MQLMFVAVKASPQEQVEKELQYAACKAHASRNAHNRRREGQKMSKRVARDSVARRSGMDGESLPLFPRLCSGLSPFEDLGLRRTPLLDRLTTCVYSYHNAAWRTMHVGRSSHRTFHPPRLEVANWLWAVFRTDICTFGSVVASIIPIFRSSVAPQDLVELENISLQLKGRSLVSLRRTLQTATPHFMPSLDQVYQVKALFREAAANGDLESARVHARMLGWLAKELLIRRIANDSLNRLALWGDAIPALLQLRRPVIDYQRWVPQLVSRIWSAAEPLLFKIPQPDEDLLPNIRSPQIRAACRHARRALAVKTACKDRRLEHSEQIFQWIVTKAEYHISSLLSLYFHLIESNSDSETTSGERHTEAALILALLFVYQKSFSRIEIGDGVDMHDSRMTICPALILHAQAALELCSVFEELVYSEAHLWLLCIGSWAEAEINSPGWCKKQLAKQTCKMGLEDEVEIRRVMSHLRDRGFPGIQQD
jgi:hypothetical protein